MDPALDPGPCPVSAGLPNVEWTPSTSSTPHPVIPQPGSLTRVAHNHYLVLKAVSTPSPRAPNPGKVPEYLYWEGFQGSEFCEICSAECPEADLCAHVCVHMHACVCVHAGALGICS